MPSTALPRSALRTILESTFWECDTNSLALGCLWYRPVDCEVEDCLLVAFYNPSNVLLMEYCKVDICGTNKLPLERKVAFYSPATAWRTIVKLTSWVCGTNSLTLGGLWYKSLNREVEDCLLVAFYNPSNVFLRDCS